MKTASISEIKANPAAYIKATESAAVVTRNGRPVTVLLGVQNDDEVERLIRPIRGNREPFANARGKTSGEVTSLSHEDFWKQVNAEHSEPREPEKAPPKSRGRKPRKA